MRGSYCYSRPASIQGPCQRCRSRLLLWGRAKRYTQANCQDLADNDRSEYIGSVLMIQSRKKYQGLWQKEMWIMEDRLSSSDLRCEIWYCEIERSIRGIIKYETLNAIGVYMKLFSLWARAQSHPLPHSAYGLSSSLLLSFSGLYLIHRNQTWQAFEWSRFCLRL